MRIQFSIVPLPMTAAEKFNEAAYFYSQMIATVNNTRTFPFNLSAFLSALRSTTFYLQVQYGNDERFAGWYAKAQEIMKGDPVLKTLKDFRTEAIHQKPVNLAVYSGPKLHENPTTTTRLEITHVPDPDGNITWRYRLGHDGKEQNAGAITDWEFETNGESVLRVCQHGLTELQKLLNSWHDVFEKGTGDKHMNYTLTIHPDAWLRDAPLAAGGEVTGFQVGGMPDGKTARIANFGAPNRNDWQILRINVDNTQGDWTGHYRSVEEALAVIEQDYD
jgi:hypothetical protein